VHAAIVSSIPPEEMAAVLRWMLPAMNHDERIGMLAGMRATAPAPAFDGAMQLARQRLPAAEFARLEHTLRVAAQEHAALAA
jgi:hypothetical protein